jgi:hypothetical protein
MDGMVLFGAVRFGMAVMAGYVSVRLVWVRRSRCGAVRFALVPRGSVSLGGHGEARSVKSGYGMESCGLVRRSRLVMVRQGEETFGD